MRLSFALDLAGLVLISAAMVCGAEGAAGYVEGFVGAGALALVGGQLAGWR